MTAWMTARISGDNRASAWPMSPYSTDSSTWSSAAGTAPACPDTATTLPRVRRLRRLSMFNCRVPSPEKIHPRDGNIPAFRSRVTVPNPAKAADGGRQTGHAS
jgi:hypothetical protein